MKEKFIFNEQRCKALAEDERREALSELVRISAEPLKRVIFPEFINKFGEKIFSDEIRQAPLSLDESKERARLSFQMYMYRKQEARKACREQKPYFVAYIILSSGKEIKASASLANKAYKRGFLVRDRILGIEFCRDQKQAPESLPLMSKALALRAEQEVKAQAARILARAQKREREALAQAQAAKQAFEDAKKAFFAAKRREMRASAEYERVFARDSKALEALSDTKKLNHFIW